MRHDQSRLSPLGLCGSVHTRPQSGRKISAVHELSICQALLSQVTALAREQGAQAIERIVVEVGPLSGVEGALLARAFEVARRGSCAAEAILVIDTPLVIVRCLGCGARSPAAPNRLLCDACGGYRTSIIAGDELNLRRVELQMPDSTPASVRPATADEATGAGREHV